MCGPCSHAKPCVDTQSPNLVSMYVYINILQLGFELVRYSGNGAECMVRSVNLHKICTMHNY